MYVMLDAVTIFLDITSDFRIGVVFDTIIIYKIFHAEFDFDFGYSE